MSEPVISGKHKVIDHVFSKLDDILPEPVFMKDSTKFAIKGTIAVFAILFIISCIVAYSIYKIKNTKESCNC